MIESNMTWALQFSLQQQLEILESQNYGFFELTVIINDDINGVYPNCGIKITAKHNDPIGKTKVINLNYLGEIVN